MNRLLRKMVCVLSRALARVAWLIPKMADCGGDQRKSRQNRKRKQRQRASEGIIKKVKGDDAEHRLAKQRQRMANHRAHETGKQRYQQVISIIGSLLSVNNSSSSPITGRRDGWTSDSGPRTAGPGLWAQDQLSHQTVNF